MTDTTAMRKSTSNLLLLLVLGVAAFIQFSVVLRTTIPFPVVSDSSEYFSYAYNLKHSGIYSVAHSWAGAPQDLVIPDSVRSPGYPLFLMAIPGLEPSDNYFRRVALVQASLGVLSVWLVFLIASVNLRPGWSHLAAAFTAISPHLANASTYLLTEALFLFLLLAAVHRTISAARTGKTSALVVAGLLWGCASLVRPTVLFLPPLLVLLAFAAPQLRQYLRSSVFLLAAALAIQAPWLIRNQMSPLDPTQGSLLVSTIHHGSYPGFMYQGRPETLGWPFRFDPQSKDAESSLGNVLAHVGSLFSQRPLTYTHWYLLGKPGTFLSWGHVQGRDIYVYETEDTPFKKDRLFAALRMAALATHWPLMLLGVGAALLIWLRPRYLHLNGGSSLFAARFISVVVLYAIAFHVIAAPYPRYGLPFRPLIQILAVMAIFASIANWSPARARNESA